LTQPLILNYFSELGEDENCHPICNISPTAPAGLVISTQSEELVDDGPSEQDENTYSPRDPARPINALIPRSLAVLY
tara:strand:- start:504 stop:734 length:231 start_codon:yes stop_codon:yes gene_type:complete